MVGWWLILCMWKSQLLGRFIHLKLLLSLRRIVLRFFFFYNLFFYISPIVQGMDFLRRHCQLQRKQTKRLIFCQSLFQIQGRFGGWIRLLMGIICRQQRAQQGLWIRRRRLHIRTNFRQHSQLLRCWIYRKI